MPTKVEGSTMLEASTKLVVLTTRTLALVVWLVCCCCVARSVVVDRIARDTTAGRVVAPFSFGILEMVGEAVRFWKGLSWVNGLLKLE